MFVEETDIGLFRAYCAAIQADQGGYAAATVIKQIRGVASPTEVFRDEHLAAPQLWDDAEAALRFALAVSAQLAGFWSDHPAKLALKGAS